MKIWQLCFDVNNYANLQAVPPLTADEIQSFNGSKEANKLVLDCTINKIEFSNEDIDTILSAVHRDYPELQVEIWTLNGIFY